eukprot:SAG22_NODE_1372_length_4577_cov_3.556052_6_plen_95_part_01
MRLGAQACLQAAFEATLLVGALLARRRQQRVTVYLTAIGGGAFGNRSGWIRAALEVALSAVAREPLDVRLVHYGAIPRSDYAVLETKARRPARGG